MVTALAADVEVIPAWLYFAGPSVTLMMSALVGVIILHYRSVQNGKLWPKTTVELLIKQKDDQIESTEKDCADQILAMRAEMTARMDNFRADHAVRMDQTRVDHEKQLEALVKVADGIRADFATTNESREAVFSVVLASKDRDIDGWRTAWMTADEAGNQEVITKLDTLLAGDETIRRWFQAFQERTAPDNG